MTIEHLLADLFIRFDQGYDVTATQHFDWSGDFTFVWYTGHQLIRKSDKKIIAVLDLGKTTPGSKPNIAAFQPWQDMSMAEYYFLKKYGIPVSEMNQWWEQG